MQDPIEKLLKEEKQVALARMEDQIVEALYEVDQGIVMHGGTAIWRCYGGKRFSYDVDIYTTEVQQDKLNNSLTYALSRHNIKMEYPKYTPRAIPVFNGSAKTKIEAMPSPPRLKPVQREYVRADGTKMFITTLSKDDLIMEKIETYHKRMYARDLYDIYHLVSLGSVPARIKAKVIAFTKTPEKPIDEAKLKDLVYSGVAPSFDTMIERIRGELG